MVDRVSEEKRSWIMSRVGSRNTKPEIIVRRFLHAKGFRYRLHNKNIIGKPDLSNQKRKIAVFVNGCFWHRHGCKRTTTPETNKEFWLEKFNKNIKRDRENIKTLKKDNWTVIVVWECEIKELESNTELNELLKPVKKW
tara:strand:- start:1196 stop:1612 length:417 start_codon:yes stop_codon:yes gene_type:complete